MALNYPNSPWRSWKHSLAACCGVALAAMLFFGASVAHAGESCGGEGERGCCVLEQIPSCDNPDLIEDLTPSCVNQLGDGACLCRGQQTLFVNPLGTKSLGVCRKKKDVGESCDPVFDPCLPNLQCRATGFENALIQYSCFADVEDSISTADCNALYNQPTHNLAIFANQTLNFGIGISATIGVAGADEKGVVYGRDGCYGCYNTFCAGASVSAGVGTYAVSGQSDVDVQCDPDDAECISFDGVACTEALGFGTGIDFLGWSVGAVQAGECLKPETLKQVGVFQAFEVGLGVSPVVTPEIAKCTTQMKVTSCLDDNGNVDPVENSPPRLATNPQTTLERFVPLNQECNGYPKTTFQMPSGFMMDPDGDALTYVWIPSLSSGLTFEPSNAPEPDVSYEHPLSPPPLDFGIDYSQFISTVQGRVYVDTNDNGNPDPGEPGLASAQVSVFNFFADDVTAVLTPNTNGDYSAIVTSGDTLEVSPTMLPTGESVRFTQTRSMGCATPSKLAVVRASDGELETAEAFFVRFTDTQAPVITPGAADQTVECDGAGNQAAVTSWLNSNGGAFASESCTSETWSNDFSAFSSGAGAKTVAFTATDECGLSASTSATFTIEDTTPPSITSVTASPDMLWPPNHKMAAVTIQVDASDICDGGAPGCEITAISSNEPINSSDDGDTAPDLEITGPLTANIRAERSGTGTGRTYTLDVTCTDEQGHATVSSTTVTVPLEL